MLPVYVGINLLTHNAHFPFLLIIIILLRRKLLVKHDILFEYFLMVCSVDVEVWISFVLALGKLFISVEKSEIYYLMNFH